jgi:hypothetical protein
MPSRLGKPRRHGGIVDFDPGLHIFWRFHIKPRFLAQQNKQLPHAKLSVLLQEMLVVW